MLISSLIIVNVLEIVQVELIMRAAQYFNRQEGGGTCCHVHHHHHCPWRIVKVGFVYNWQIVQIIIIFRAAASC